MKEEKSGPAATEKEKRTFVLKINAEACKSCNLCVEFCPKRVLAMSKSLNLMGVPFAETVRPEFCTGCRACTAVCPDAVIELYQIV